MSNKLLICTDLDRTLIPHGDASESVNARHLFTQLVSKSFVTLAYITHKDKKILRSALKQYQLPYPNFVIADVGSTIYTLKNHQWLRLKDWDNHIGKDWQL